QSAVDGTQLGDTMFYEEPSWLGDSQHLLIWDSLNAGVPQVASGVVGADHNHSGAGSTTATCSTTRTAASRSAPANSAATAPGSRCCAAGRRAAAAASRAGRTTGWSSTARARHAPDPDGVRVQRRPR